MSKEEFYKYGESLGININDLQRLKMLANKSVFDGKELNDEAMDSYINNYTNNLPTNWTTMLDMYLAMKNAMIEALSYPNKYIDKGKNE
jgi:hypothetical protein